MSTAAQSDPASAYWAARAKSLQRGFDRLALRLKPLLAERYGAGAADAILDDARDELARLIPELPYIGGSRNVFTWVIAANAYIVSLFRAMKPRGHDAREVVQICVEVSDGMMRRIPAPLRRLIGRVALSWPARRLFREQAARSQERRFDADFVWTVREGGDDDFAFVFEECAVNKMYDAMDVRELAPYCNFFDVTYSRLTGMGVDATRTIGLGCETCELRYKHGRETVPPPKLRPVFDAVDRTPTADAAKVGATEEAER